MSWIESRYFGGKKIKHSYGIRLKDCPYDIGFEIAKIKDKNGKMISVLEPKGDSELIEVENKNSVFYEKSKNGIEKVGFKCNMLEQAYDLVQFVERANTYNRKYNINVLENHTLVMEVDVPNYL